MTFLQPLWLILVPVVLAFAFVSGRLTRRIVAPDWLLVHRAMQRLQGATRGRRRFHGSLNLVPPILLALALAQPIRQGHADVVILLDRSAGGGAATEDGSRISRALAVARDAHPSAEVRGFPEPRTEQALSQSSGITTSVADLIEVANTLVASGRSVAIATWRDVEPPPPVGVYGVNDTLLNAGLAAVRLLDDGSLWVRTAGTAGAPPRRLLLIGSDGATLLTRDVKTPAGTTMTLAALETRGVAGLKLEPADADPSDDMVWLRGSAATLRVAVASGVGGDLIRALRSIPEADVIEAEDKSADLSVGFVGDHMSLLVNPPTWGPDWGRPVRRNVEPGIVGEGSFAVLHDADARVGVLWALPELPPQTEVVVRAGREPLLMKRRALWILTADGTSGDWATRAVFPRLIAAIAASSSVATRLSVARCGEFVHVPSRSGKGLIQESDGTTSPVMASPSGLPITCDSPGVVRVSHDGVATELAFAVLSDEASAVLAGQARTQPPGGSMLTESYSLTGFLFWLAAASAIWLLLRGR